MTIRFYRRDNRWFADLPLYLEAGGTEDDCELIAGADEWLDIVSNYKDSVYLRISDIESLQEKLVLHEVDNAQFGCGAIYVIQEYQDQVINKEIWLCPVTLFIFGYYPPIIFYSKMA